MRIPKNLKHLTRKNEDALLLVTGKQDAVIYKASKGQLEKLDSFKLPTPHFSDNENRGIKEIQDRDTVRDFMHELLIHLKNISADKIPSIYLFTPSNVKNRIMNALPTELRKHIKAVVEGNYFNMAPADLMLKLA